MGVRTVSIKLPVVLMLLIIAAITIVLTTAATRALLFLLGAGHGAALAIAAVTAPTATFAATSKPDK